MNNKNKTLNFSSYLIALILLMFTIQCSVKNRIIKRPKKGRGKVSEFHRQARKYIPVLYASYNLRGVQVIGDRPFVDNLGIGAGTFYNVPISNQWVGHKLFYIYMDVEVSQEGVLKNKPFPGGTTVNMATNPGLFLRHWVPFAKIFYGAGINARFLPSEFDNWGIYAQAGVQVANVFLASSVIIHPGQSNVSMEYKMGWMF